MRTAKPTITEHRQHRHWVAVAAAVATASPVRILDLDTEGSQAADHLGRIASRAVGHGDSEDPAFCRSQPFKVGVELNGGVRTQGRPPPGACL